MTNRSVRTSEKITPGELYTRKELATMFSISDATINTGVFQPKGHSSVWLFVTEKKQANRTQYTDRLAGDILHWQGQSSGRSDQLIIDHNDRGLELLVFYREKSDSPFRYEGIFEYAEHSGAKPTSFKLRRLMK
jgi:putative restriction endonuclease